MKHLNPAHAVIQKFGGVEAVAATTGKHISRIYRWTYPRDRGGTGGLIPPADAQKILRAARERGLDITASDFFDIQAAHASGAAAGPVASGDPPEPCDGAGTFSTAAE